MMGTTRLLLLGLLAGCTHRTPPPGTPNDPLGRAVSFALPTDKGQMFNIPVPGARTMVLSFFGPKCEPCRKSVSDLNAKRSTLAAHGSKLFFIALLGEGESQDDAQRALQSWGVEASFLVDSHGAAARKSGVSAVPTTMVLDAHGVTKWVSNAAASVEDVLMATE